MYRAIRIAAVTGLLLTVFTGNALAAPENRAQRPYNNDADWSLVLGALLLHKPEYEGGEDYEVRAFPVVDITWGERYFFNPRKGLGGYLLDVNDKRIGFSIGYAFGRDEDDANILTGLGDIDGGATANVLFDWKFDDFTLDARLEEQFSGEDTGFTVSAGLGYAMRYGDKILLKPSLRTRYASADYAEAYFGISPAQSARSGLPVYDAGSGFKSLGVSLLSIYRIDRNWGAQAMAAYGRLLGDSKDSPITKDKNQYRLGIGMSYRF